MSITAYRKIAGVEITLSDSTNHIFPKHSHDEFYIGANISGREKIWLDGKNAEASVDEITVYNPGQIQAAEPTPYDWWYYSFYVSPEAMMKFTDLEPDDHFKKSIFSAPDVALQIRQVAAFVLNSHISDSEANEQLAGLLLSVLSRSGIHTHLEINSSDKVVVDYVISRLMDDLLSPPSLQELASETGLSPVQLVRIFTHAKGLPPFAWCKGERLRQGKNLILQGRPLSDISAQLGFTDQAHFTRNFKSMFGFTPGQLYKLSSCKRNDVFSP